MPQRPPSSDLAALAEAIRRLRSRTGLSQEQAAAEIGQTKQSWQAYEAGNRQVLLRSDVQDRVARALGLTRDDIQREAKAVMEEAAGEGRAPEAAQIPTAPLAGADRAPRPLLHVPVWGRARAGVRGAHVYDIAEPERYLDLAALYGPSCRAMQLIGDSVYPWAASGTTVVYDLDRMPRREQGCVIETLEEGYFVKIFERSDDRAIYAWELQPEKRLLEYDWKDVRGLYAVLDRIDR